MIEQIAAFDPLVLWTLSLIVGLTGGAGYVAANKLYDRWVTTSEPDIPSDPSNDD